MGKVTFTNRYNLPDSIVNAVKIDRHVTRGDISVTTLIDAPQIRMLRRKHDTTEDVSERTWALFGTAIHHILELGDIRFSSARKLYEAANILESIANNDAQMVAAAKYIRHKADIHFPDASNSDIVTEQTLSLEVDNMVLSGTFDRLMKSSKTLQDYKSTSVNSYMYADTHEKWEKQLNIYRYMIYHVLGVLVEKIEVIGIFRDWKASETFNKLYPKSPIASINVKVWSLEETEAYIKERIRIHTMAEMGTIIPCSGRERWASSDTFKVKAKGKKRSIRNLPSLALAEDFLSKNKFEYPGAYIETIPGEPRRCLYFCPVKEFCQQHQDYLKKITELQED